MSFAEVRRLVAILNELGFPGTLSMDSFQYPNFELVADCLNWLLIRYDPIIHLDLDISTDRHRVDFLKRATHIMFHGARIKLNPRHLYSADGYAAKELLKVASLLQNYAINTATRSGISLELDSSIKAFDVKLRRLIVNEITKHGGSLCGLLNLDPMTQESQSKATAMNINMDEIDQGLRGAISTMLESISSAQQNQETTAKDKGILQDKLDKRWLELECSEECLSTLHNVRPAYMDKYKALQKDLQELFVVYSMTSRNLQWLQSQMEGHNQEEKETMDTADSCMHSLQHRLYKEELSIIRGEEVDGSNASLGMSEEFDEEGKMFWKWFDGDSFKTVLGPHDKPDHLPTRYNMIQESFKGLPKGPTQWMSQTESGLKDFENPMLNSEFSSGLSTKISTKCDFQIERGFKPGVSDSEPSMDRSDISGALEETDTEPLEVDDIDQKDTGEDNSSDDDF
ncbi:unnamed protein product [Calypogeia fissa]